MNDFEAGFQQGKREERERLSKIVTHHRILGDKEKTLRALSLAAQSTIASSDMIILEASSSGSRPQGQANEPERTNDQTGFLNAAAIYAARANASRQKTD